MIGIVISFLLCGFVSLAGKRGSAPTMVLCRTMFGVHGDRLPTAISWILTVGWETGADESSPRSATATVSTGSGAGGGRPDEVIALLVVAAAHRRALGVFGFT